MVGSMPILGVFLTEPRPHVKSMSAPVTTLNLVGVIVGLLWTPLEVHMEVSSQALIDDRRITHLICVRQFRGCFGPFL